MLAWIVAFATLLLASCDVATVKQHAREHLRTAAPISLSLAELEKLTPEDAANVNIYTVMRAGFPAASGGNTDRDVDEFTTLVIKSLMARLLYSVDLRDLKRPDEDERFREALIEFERNSGSEPDGVLTNKEFQKLTELAQKWGQTKIYPPGKFVRRSGNDYVSAKGTWVLQGERAAYPINHVNIFCKRMERSCEIVTVDVATDTEVAHLAVATAEWPITRWDSHEVEALHKGDCRQTRLVINTETETAYQTTTDMHAKQCSFLGVALPKLDKPRIATLEDGFKAAQQHYKEITEEVRPALPTYMSQIWKRFEQRPPVRK